MSSPVPPVAPPLQPWSSLSTSSSPSLSSSTTFDSPTTDAGAFTPHTTPSTAFTTPASSKSLWGEQGEPARLRLVGERASTKPTGFEVLDAGYKGETGADEARSFEWEAYANASSSSDAPTVFKRRLGPTEVSYYLGSRGEGIEGGVNDMYLHLGFKARSDLMNPDRVLDVWTEIVSRHALLASSVEFADYYDIRFRYEPPKTAAEARIKASSLLDLRTNQDGKVLLDAYLNGPRTLSDDRLAYLVISTPESTFSSRDDEQEYDFFLFSTHFLGDGMALHTTANEFFTLLGGSPSEALQDGVEGKNIEALRLSHGEPVPSASTPTLAPAMESKLLLPRSWSRLGWSAARVEFENDQSSLIGGHAFPRAKLDTRKTAVPTVSYDSDNTKRILGTCKKNGVTIAAAAFALANAAFVRSVKEERRNPTLPTMIYSALNVRPYLSKEETDWYHIAIGYYNVILPSFFPSSIPTSAAFWHQALSVRTQTSKAVKSPFLAPRTALMALERERRSIGWEKEDDAKRLAALETAQNGLQGLGIEAEGDEKVEEAERLKKEAVEMEKRKKAEADKEEEKPRRVKVPNTALMGCSMLGNLDGMYKHADFHGIQLHTLTTGSRQRPGALLLFAYTFAGKLWFSLGYDQNGFEKGSIESWWDELLKGVDEFLMA
ncbi:hypothetical protein JCM8547_006187 [Rhodosporidiobolus lusitaniae]